MSAASLPSNIHRPQPSKCPPPRASAKCPPPAAVQSPPHPPPRVNPSRTYRSTRVQCCDSSDGASGGMVMATTVVIGNSNYKRRNPLAVWIGLEIITLGIYHLVWWYKINDEARRFLGDPSVRPARSVLALFPG